MGAVAFPFWHAPLNDERAYFETIQETTPAIALIVGGVCLGLTVGAWSFFRLKKKRVRS